MNLIFTHRMFAYLTFALFILFHARYCHSRVVTGDDAGYSVTENGRFKRANGDTSCMIVPSLSTLNQKLSGAWHAIMKNFTKPEDKNCQPKKIVMGTQSPSKLYTFLYALIAHDVQVIRVEKGGNVMSEKELNLDEEFLLQKGNTVKGKTLVNCVKADSDVPEQPEEKHAKGGIQGRIVNAVKLDNEGDEYYAIESYINVEQGKIMDYALIGCMKHVPGTEADKVDKSKIIYKKSKGVEFEREAYDAAKAAGFDTTTVGMMMETKGYVTNNKDPHRDVKGVHIARHVFLAEAVVECMTAMHAGSTPNKLKFVQVYIDNKEPKPKHLQHDSRVSTSVMVRNVDFANFQKEILKMVDRSEKKFKAEKIFVTHQEGEEIKKGNSEFSQRDFANMLKQEHPLPVYVTGSPTT